MRRAFGFDVLACSRCGGRLRLIAALNASDVAQRSLRHLGLPTEGPAARPVPEGVGGTASRQGQVA